VPAATFEIVADVPPLLQAYPVGFPPAGIAVALPLLFPQLVLVLDVEAVKAQLVAQAARLELAVMINSLLFASITRNGYSGTVIVAFVLN